jgi:hypothetical protein
MIFFELMLLVQWQMIPNGDKDMSGGSCGLFQGTVPLITKKVYPRSGQGTFSLSVQRASVASYT